MVFLPLAVLVAVGLKLPGEVANAVRLANVVCLMAMVAVTLNHF
jgi:hypothetical protein